MKIVIREYEPTDKEGVMVLIRLNTPGFFAPEEEADFKKYLEEERELYYVVLWDGQIVGCGGINFANNKRTGKISWDIIHPDYQGRALGTRFLRYRIKLLSAMNSIEEITVRTSQVAYRFYEKHGFILNEVVKDYWAEGLDMYNIEYAQQIGGR